MTETEIAVLVTTDRGRLLLKSVEGEPTLVMQEREPASEPNDWFTVSVLAEGDFEFDLFLELVSTGQGEKIPDWDHLK